MKLLTIFFITVSFESAFSKTPLSWKSALEKTTAQNEKLKSSRATVESQHYLEKKSYSPFLPSLSGNLSYSKSNTVNLNNLTNDRSDTISIYSAGLSVSQNLFSGFSDLAQVKKAKATTKKTLADYQLTKAQISSDLKTAFANLNYATNYQVLTEEIMKRREENLNLVKLRYEGGMENKGSVLLSEAYFQQANYDFVVATNAQKVAQRDLGRVLGEEDQEYLITDQVPEISVSQNPNFSSLVETNPDFLKIAFDEEISLQDIRVARANFFPKLSLNGTLRDQEDRFFPDTPDDRWTVSLNLSIPIFDGGADYFNTKSSVQKWVSSASTKKNLEKETLTKLEKSYATYRESIARLKMDESFNRASKTRAEIARKKYNNGLLTFENWDIIENDLITRQKTYLQSQREKVTAEAAWELAQGIGAIE
jgi:outer membrane protein